MAKNKKKDSKQKITRRIFTSRFGLPGFLG